MHRWYARRSPCQPMHYSIGWHGDRLAYAWRTFHSWKGLWARRSTQVRVKSDQEFGKLSADLTNNGVRLTYRFWMTQWRRKALRRQSFFFFFFWGGSHCLWSMACTPPKKKKKLCLLGVFRRHCLRHIPRQVDDFRVQFQWRKFQWQLLCKESSTNTRTTKAQIGHCMETCKLCSV